MSNIKQLCPKCFETFTVGWSHYCHPESVALRGNPVERATPKLDRVIAGIEHFSFNPKDILLIEALIEIRDMLKEVRRG